MVVNNNNFYLPLWSYKIKLKIYTIINIYTLNSSSQFYSFNY